MTCSPFDLRDYLFEELTPAQSGDVRSSATPRTQT